MDLALQLESDMVLTTQKTYSLFFDKNYIVEMPDWWTPELHRDLILATETILGAPVGAGDVARRIRAIKFVRRFMVSEETDHRQNPYGSKFAKYFVDHVTEAGT